jgi:hypothetical protein
MNPASIVLCTLLSLLVLAVPKRMLLLPFIINICLIPMNQRLIIVGMDFPVLRILILICILRLLVRNEIRQISWNSFDKLVLKWNIVGTIIYVILWGTLQSFIYKCGTMYEGLGLYWIVRQFIQSFDDISTIIKQFAIFAIISAPLIAAEKLLQSSFYSFFGPVGVKFHHGRFRCAGPFSHYIIMGVFWSSLLPLFYAKIKSTSSLLFYWTAIFAALTCIYFSASSTPIMTVVAIIIFWKLFSIRVHGKKIMWCVFFILFALHLAMKAPVWHLLSRVDVFGGSTGWFRYFLFDEFIKHTTEWFFIGTQSTVEWGRGLFDITNQYVFEAVQGGFITLFLFLLVLYNSIKISGKYSFTEEDISKKFISWGVCVSLLGHVITFWGVSYFGQMTTLFYLTLAIVGFIHEEANNKAPIILNN